MCYPGTQVLYAVSNFRNPRRRFLDRGIPRSEIWDVHQGSLIRLLEGHKQKVRCVALNKDMVFSASDDKTAKMWSISEGEYVHTLMGHTSEIYALAVNVQQGSVSTGSKNKTIPDECGK